MNNDTNIRQRHLFYLASIVLSFSSHLHAAPQQSELAGKVPAAEDRDRLPAAGSSAQDLAALPVRSWLKNGGNLFNQNYSEGGFRTPPILGLGGAQFEF